MPFLQYLVSSKSSPHVREQLTKCQQKQYYIVVNMLWSIIIASFQIVVKVSPTNTITDMYFSLLSSMAPASVQKSPEKQKGKIHGYLYVWYCSKLTY